MGVTPSLEEKTMFDITYIEGEGEKVHKKYMLMALKEAEKALERSEVPVGAVIVKGQEVIAKAHNQRELLQDPTAHAELLAITQACAHMKNWRLLGCRLYVTLEPCPMCAGAIVQARIPEVFIGAMDPKAGACGSLMNLLDDKRLNHRVKIAQGLLQEESKALLDAFFQGLRQRSERQDEGE